MSIFSKSILLKLWLVMVGLVLVVLYFTGTVQTGKLKELYYSQQLEQMTKEAEHIAASLGIYGGSQNDHYLAALADALNGNVMVTDTGGYIEQCVGMGMDMRNVAHQRINVTGHHDIPLKEPELQSVLQGKAISYRGPYHFLGTDVLTVAVPLYQEGRVTGTVMLSAPLAPIEERIAELQRVTRYAGLVGIILATFLSLLFSRTLSRPLLNMNQAARAMARGDYSRRIEVKSKDEMGLLAESLNSLATKLQDKIAALERLDRTRREFVANVSHELRTPLSIMQGYTEALLDGMAGSEADRQKYLGNIHEEILRLRRLVTEILDLRKIEAGRVEMEMKEVSLADIAGRVVDKLRALAEEKKIKVIQNFPPGPAKAWADPDRLEQVFINLLDNAIRVTHSGGRVEVAVKDLKGEIVISVSDDGPGITPEEQPLIWERFYKVDKSRTRKGGGTGLGLAIVKEIVEAHGGSIKVVSKPGEGSTFVFTIPKSP
ncbi:MAG: cell wall metabolism sensor histidine kinase WalK [Peptococcaceae bacterium]|nr:cell wall metabolism sensor histidine kinase WalK [Peptococcaceae bacterium]